MTSSPEIHTENHNSLKKTPVKNKIMKNITEAHGWLGVVISIMLFSIFWTGALTLFHEEIELWATSPHVQINDNAPDMPINELLAKQVDNYPFDQKEHLTIIRAGEQYPWHRVYVDLVPEAQEDEHFVGLMVDPKTGEELGEFGDFHLGMFLYAFHYTLSLPSGDYIVGIITLIFFFALLSGLFIHVKKLFKRFFTYRSKGNKRDKQLDLHNVIGVISLPYTLMYALTGLILNLIIVYQIVYALVVYQGDQQQLLADAGYPEIEALSLTGKPLDMTRIDTLVEQVEQEYDRRVDYVQTFNYGDENAYVRIRTEHQSDFGKRFELYYTLKDFEPIFTVDDKHFNTIRDGVDVLVELHYASFAGIDLRILYFVLALGVCVLIISGNLLWLNKRRQQSNNTGFDLILGKLTLGGCSGIIVATAVAFLAERSLPAVMTGRSDMMELSFFVTWFIASAFAFLFRCYKPYLVWSLRLSSVIFILVLLVDLWGASMASLPVESLVDTSSANTFIIQIGLVIFTFIGFFASKQLNKNS